MWCVRCCWRIHTVRTTATACRWPAPRFVTLDDGRTFCYHVEVYGQTATGYTPSSTPTEPVLALHGMGLGSRMGFHGQQHDPADATTSCSNNLGGRQIGLHRQYWTRGYFEFTTTSHVGYSYTQFVKDVNEFLDKSGVIPHGKTFCVLGQSSVRVM